jgi:hypothetical protein
MCRQSASNGGGKNVDNLPRESGSSSSGWNVSSLRWKFSSSSYGNETFQITRVSASTPLNVFCFFLHISSLRMLTFSLLVIFKVNVWLRSSPRTRQSSSRSWDWAIGRRGWLWLQDATKSHVSLRRFNRTKGNPNPLV